MSKRGRGADGLDDAKKTTKRQTHQNGLISTDEARIGRRSGRKAGGKTGGGATEEPAVVPNGSTVSKGKGKGGTKEDDAAPHVQEKRTGCGGGGGAASGGKRSKKTHEEEGYEGPVEEEDSESDASSQGGDSSGVDGDDSDDEIKLDGAMTRRSDAEEDDEDEEGDDGADAGGGEGGDEQTVVNVCLDFCDPHERFFHGIRALVAHTYLQDAVGAGLSPLVDLAVAQGAVGTVISTDAEDDAVFGFLTALPLLFLARENQCVQALIKYLLDKASKAGRGSEMEEVLGKGAQGKVGLLVSARMVNCPMQAVPKLHEALVEDIAWAVQHEISEEHRDKFRFDKFIVVAPCDDAGGGGAGSGPAILSDFYFSRFDDEVLLQEADFFFSMSGAAQSGGGGSSASVGDGVQQRRCVVGVLPASKLRECVQDISQMVG